MYPARNTDNLQPGLYHGATADEREANGEQRDDDTAAKQAKDPIESVPPFPRPSQWAPRKRDVLFPALFRC